MRDVRGNVDQLTSAKQRTSHIPATRCREFLPPATSFSQQEAKIKPTFQDITIYYFNTYINFLRLY